MPLFAPAAKTILILSLTVSLGLALGQIRVRGLMLGASGVIFAGLVVGGFGIALDTSTLEFIREFGLILFVWAIGYQVGPGFFASLRRFGLRLNLLAIAVIVLGTALAAAVALILGDAPAAIGVLSGAVTNTPALGAAQQALKEIPGAPIDWVTTVGLAYAIAYPFGIFGTISAIALLRRMFRIDPERELADYERDSGPRTQPILSRSFEVTNENLAGRTIGELAELVRNVVVTRVLSEGVQHLATPDSRIALRDVLHAVGTHERLEQLRIVVGRESRVELPRFSSAFNVRRVVVTDKSALGHPLCDLSIEDKYGVIITRLIRSGVEFAPGPGVRVLYGDRLQLVGSDEALEKAANGLGDSVQDLDKTQMLPMFLGIALGVALGSLPIQFPLMPVPVKLGLAGGPLIVAILLGRLGKVGPLINYMPMPAGKLLGEFGISLFLACVGLRSGGRFFEVLLSAHGAAWLAAGAIITTAPLLIVGAFARRRMGLNYVTLCGVLAGSVTDPPALAYATGHLNSDAPSVAYATVYPLTMLLRVVLAQVFVLFLVR